jgi:hypothetical protein
MRYNWLYPIVVDIDLHTLHTIVKIFLVSLYFGITGELITT